MPGKKVSTPNKMTLAAIMPPITQSRLLAVFIKEASII
jgi:hypothetical protein